MAETPAPAPVGDFDDDFKAQAVRLVLGEASTRALLPATSI